MEEENIIYAYIKGDRYKTYKVYREGDEKFKEIDIEFETYEQLIEWCVRNSNYSSIPVQFYI